MILIVSLSAFEIYLPLATERFSNLNQINNRSSLKVLITAHRKKKFRSVNMCEHNLISFTRVALQFLAKIFLVHHIIIKHHESTELHTI